MSEKKPVVVVCPECGSPDVSVDATARWDIEAQDWVMSGTFDDRTCGSCGYEGSSFAEVEVEAMTSAQSDFVAGRTMDYVSPNRRYSVIVTRDMTESTVVEIEATDQAEAQEKAKQFARDNANLTWEPDDNGNPGDPYTNGAEETS